MHEVENSDWLISPIYAGDMDGRHRLGDHVHYRCVMVLYGTLWYGILGCAMGNGVWGMEDSMVCYGILWSAMLWYGMR